MPDQMMNVKAVQTESGTWELDVLGNPYGGPDNGRDAQGEYFAPDTQFHEDKFSLPPAVYYHGFDEDGRPAGTPEYIGRTVKRWVDAAGVWFRVVLDQTSAYAKRVWEAAQAGIARASSGSASHLVRVDPDGHIREWPDVELSIFDAVGSRQPANSYAVALPVAKAVYARAGMPLPESVAPEAAPEAPAGVAPAAQQELAHTDQVGEPEMSEEIKAAVEVAVAEALKAEREAQAAKAQQEAEQKAAVEAAVKAEREKWEAEAAKAGRLPWRDGAPVVTKFNDSKYDSLSHEDMAFMIGVQASYVGPRGQAPSEEARKSLAYKALSAAEKGDRIAGMTIKALSGAMGREVKSDEIHQSTLANHGDDWVGVQYSNQLWEAIRAGTFILNEVPSIEVPQGMESVVIPLESTDPTWYKVAQAASLPTTEATGIPNATITSSQIGTAKQTLTLAKMGCRALYSGEMEEDSLIPWVPQLRMQVQRSGIETMEHVLLDGDTATTASTNINDIAGTPAGTEAFLLVDGFRKLPLITNTANARAAGALSASDVLETVKLMGVQGLAASDASRILIIVDPKTYWALLELPEVKTRDVNVQATIESGRLTSLYGYRIRPSWHMHKLSADRLAQAADGCIDQDTTTDNVAGSILAVRPDQWLFGWKRRMTMESNRIARADTTEIVALARFGLTYRDTEAAAISYGVTF